MRCASFQRICALKKNFRSVFILLLLMSVLLFKEYFNFWDGTFLRRYDGSAGNKSKYNKVHRYTESQRQPNILFIFADDLGFNDVGYHGSEIRTPVINKLANSGIKLENYYVQPTCSPTRGQFLSGRYGIHTGLNRVIYYRQPLGLPLDNPTIADKLRESGYATHIVGKWHVGHYKTKYLPTNRGFDSFFGFLTGHSDYYTHLTRHEKMYGYDLMENDKPANISKYMGQYSTLLFAEKVKDIVRNHNPLQRLPGFAALVTMMTEQFNFAFNPLFVYLSFQAVHYPVQVPEQYITKNKHIKDERRRKYAGMVTCMDEAIGNVVEEMKKQGLWDNTILIFSTDNGASANTGASNWPLKGMKGSVYEGGIRAVGFVNSMHLDNSLYGLVSRELIQVTDWFPTLVKLGEGNTNGVKALDGFDQWETIKFGKGSPRQEILHDLSPRKDESNASLSIIYLRWAALRIGKWKIVVTFNQSLPILNQIHRPKKVELYNIQTDPTEASNLSNELPQIVNRMLQRLTTYHSGMVPIPDPEPDLLSDPAFHDGFWGPWKD